ncbi:MAG: hypothetical protein ACYTF6_09400 [Planctomycetota bacterium]|jgi:hypothetical protein
MGISARRLAALTIIPAILSAAAYAQERPPEIEIPSTSLAGILTERDKNAIEEYIRYWTKILKTAEEQAVVIEARDKLLEGYQKYSSDTYQEAYALRASEIATEILRTPPVELKQLKEVNVAIFFSKVQRTSAQGAFEVMVAHTSSAVRYLGWRSYRAVKPEILGLDRPRDIFFATLRRIAAAEESPIVAEEIFRTLAVPRLVVIPLPDEKLAEVRAELLKIFDVCWSPWCKRVLDGHTDAAESAEVGVAELYDSAEIMEKDDAARTAIMQMLADMLWCSSGAYQKAKAIEQTAEAEANDLLLKEIEKRVAILAGLSRRRITEALNNDRLTAEDKADEVRFRALDLIERGLSRFGVKDPAEKFKPKPAPPAEPPASTQPATQPAT